MSNDEPLEVQIPTSPTLDTDDGIVHSVKEFSDVLTLDLTDDEIKNAFETTVTIMNKYHQKWVFMNFDNEDKIVSELDQFRDEISYTLAERSGILATVDATPVLYGKPPVVEFLGRIPGTSFDKHGMDHEKKEWEVKKATQLGKDYLGQE